MCRAFKVDVIGFLSPLRGWLFFPLHTHGLRRGLDNSTAASRLGFGGTRVEFGGLGLEFGG